MFLCSSAGENLVPESQSQRKKINEEENDSFWWQQSWLYAEWLWLSEPNASSWPTDSFRNAQFFIPTSTSSTSTSHEWFAAQREPAAGSGLSVRLPEELLHNEHYKLPVHGALQHERERTAVAVLQESPAWHSFVHISFKYSKSRATCQVCRIAQVPKGNGNGCVPRVLVAGSLCKRMPCRVCATRQASLQSCRRWVGTGREESWGPDMATCYSTLQRKKKHKMGHGQSNIAEAVTAAVHKCSLCPSPLGKESIPSPLISTQVPCTNLTFTDFTHGSW